MSSRKQLARLKEKELIRRKRRSFSAEDKMRIVLEGINGKVDISELCQKEGIPVTVYKSWAKDFMEAGKRKLSGDLRSESASVDIQILKKENLDLKQLVAELTLEVRTLRKNLNNPV